MISQACPTPLSHNLSNFVKLMNKKGDFDGFEIIQLNSVNINDYQRVIKQAFSSSQFERTFGANSDLDKLVSEDYEHLLTLLPISMLLFKQKYSSTTRYFTLFFEEFDSVITIHPINLSLLKNDPKNFYIEFEGKFCLPFSSRMGYDSSVVDQIFSSTTYLLPFDKNAAVIENFGSYHHDHTAKKFEVEVRVFKSGQNHFEKLNRPSEEEIDKIKNSYYHKDLTIINTRFSYNSVVILDEYDLCIKPENEIIMNYVSMFLTNPEHKHGMILDIKPAPTKEYCDYYKSAKLGKVIEMIKC